MPFKLQSCTFKPELEVIMNLQITAHVYIILGFQVVLATVQENIITSVKGFRKGCDASHIAKQSFHFNI